MENEKISEMKNYLPDEIMKILYSLPEDTRNNIREIRIRKNWLLSLSIGHNNYFIDVYGNLSVKPLPHPVITEKNIFDEIFNRITDFSLHSKMQEISEGFISLKKGSRAALCGRAIVENGKISGVRDVSSIVIRIAGDYKNISGELIDKIFKQSLCGLVIAGEPGSGKTTLLRDLAFSLSEGRSGRSYRVAVVDERNEISSGNNKSFEVLSGYPKSIGIITAIRALSPDVIICDELKDRDEAEAVIDGLNAGVPVITTVHASSIKECKKKPQLNLLAEYNAFEYLAILQGKENPSKIKEIYKRDDLKNENSRDFNYSSVGCNAGHFKIGVT